MHPQNLPFTSWRKSSYSNGNGGECVECASDAWTKSSYSGSNGGDCVECASATWTTSTHSANSANCVEAAALPASVALRDSKHPRAGHLTLPSGEWSAFLTALKHDALHT